MEYYSQNSGEWVEKGFIRKGKELEKGKKIKASDYVLTLEAKKKIIVEQIFGVDMDREAVEIAKLSLCLKVLEGENNGTIDEEKLKHGEPALPTLSENIKSGNSLLDSKQGAGVLFAEAEKEYKLKPFIWSEEFEKVFENNGFDYVFANPPYISMKKFPKDQVSTIYKDFILKNYVTFYDKSDIYCCFFELALRKENGILKNGGKMGFITSSTYFAEKTFDKLRELLFANTVLGYSIPQGDIFKPRASVNAAVMMLEKTENKNPKNSANIYKGKKILNEENNEVLAFDKVSKVKQQKLIEFKSFLTEASEKTIEILTKCQSFVPLGDIVEMNNGVATGDNEVWLNDRTGTRTRKKWLENKSFEEQINLKKYYKGEHIQRYFLSPTKIEINYLPDLMTKHSLSKSRRSSAWPRNTKIFERIKIFSCLIGNEFAFCLDTKLNYFDINVNGLYIKDSHNYLNNFILGILNSKLTKFYLNKARTNLSITQSLLKKLTIPPVPLETQREIAEWVRKLTDLYEIFYTQKETWTDAKIKEEEARLVRVEYEIDKRVCELYGVDYEDLK